MSGSSIQKFTRKSFTPFRNRIPSLSPFPLLPLFPSRQLVSNFLMMKRSIIQTGKKRKRKKIDKTKEEESEKEISRRRLHV